MTSLRRIARLAGAAALAAVAVACRADDGKPPTEWHCQLHDARSMSLDLVEQRLLLAHPFMQIRVCTATGVTTGPNPGYELVSVPARGAAGLCRYTDEAANGRGVLPVDDHSRRVYLREGDGPCPAPGSAGYFVVDGVVDADVPRLLGLLRGMASSDAGFDKAAADLDPAKSPSSAEQYDFFRRAIRSGATHLLSIERIGPHDDLESGWFLTLDDSSQTSRTWRLALVPAGERLLLRRIDEGASD